MLYHFPCSIKQLEFYEFERSCTFVGDIKGFDILDYMLFDIIYRSS